jgi:uncharacterized membrane-anchored protein YhcB (DUF1043 family)
MLDLPNIKIVFNNFNTGISFSFSNNKKDCEKKELEDDVTESDDLEKIVDDYFVVYHENNNHSNCLLIEKNNQFLFDTRIEKKHSFDILIPPPETI